MATKTSETNQLQNFEKAREATLTLLALKDTLTSSELETLEVLVDKSAKEHESSAIEQIWRK
ncbi:MAG: hypothetical protein AAB567_00380 [Patescibacteria group bacterium]